MPVFNSEKTLDTTIGSVLSQSFRDFELICVDDGSSDGSYEILMSFHKKDNRVKVIKQKNQFAGIARNNGTSHSVGRFITFLDSDDIMLQDGLQKLYDAITKRNVDIVRASAISDTESGGKTLNWCVDCSIAPREIFSWKDIPDKIFLLSAGNPWSMIVKRELITNNEIKFPNFPRTEDIVFTYLCYMHAKSISVIPDCIIQYRTQNSGMEKTKINYPTVPLESRLFLKKEIEKLGVFHNVRDSFWYRGFISFIDQLKKLSIAKDFSNAEIYYKQIKSVIDAEKYTFESRESCLDIFLPLYPELHKIQKTHSLNDYLSTTGLSFEQSVFKYNLGIQPLVSIIMPVFNSAKYLRQCLNSLLNQTNNNFEVICVNDGSEDESLDILKSYEHQYPKLFTVITKDNTNAGDARNIGMLHAHGKYLLFLDSDDIFKSTLIEETTKIMDKTWCDILIFGVNVYNNVTKQYHSADWLLRWEYLTKKEFAPEDVHEFLFQITTPNPWNKMYKSSYIWEHDFKYQSLKRANDALFTYSAMVSAKKIAVLEKRLVNWRTNNPMSLQGSNTKGPTCFIEAYLMIKEYLDSINKYKLYEQSFLNIVLSTVVYTFNSLKNDESRVKLLIAIDNKLSQLGILNREKRYYYDCDKYDEYVQITGPIHHYYMGIAYRDGIVVEKNYKKSMQYFELSTKEGIQKSQEEMVKLVLSNEPQKYESISKTIDEGPLLRILARHFMEIGDEEKAVNYYSAAIDSGETDLLREYTDYLYRTDKEENLKKCLSLCTRFAKNNNKDALFRLAQMYRNGKGVPANIETAIELMQRAIDNGHKGAIKEITLMRK
ncbi:MAG: glycosyltransferase [Candidatus Methanomethylophilaceae archaeon]|nr:glycosyltransferase [Candidatus Methanomethylophilaceae archaeon]